VIDGFRSAGASIDQDPATDLLTINREFTVSLVIARCLPTPAGTLRWKIRFDAPLKPDLTVAIRMDAANTTPIDYYVLPLRDGQKATLRLLRSVEAGTLPVSVAIEIADADDADVQNALQTAYEKGELRGRKLLAAKRLIEARRRWGRGLALNAVRPPPTLSSADVVRAYEEEADRKRDMIRRANAAKDMLALIAEAVRRLSADQAFLALLVEEGLDSMPEKVAVRSMAVET